MWSIIWTDLLIEGHELYAALAAGDVASFRRLLSPDFQGQLCEGLPHGFGRRYDGFEPMLRDGWGVIRRWFQLKPQPDDLIDGGGVLIARGAYVGIAKPTGKAVRAAFAHFWRFDGTQFTAVIQVTDTGKWRDALALD